MLALGWKPQLNRIPSPILVRVKIINSYSSLERKVVLEIRKIRRGEETEEKVIILS